MKRLKHSLNLVIAALAAFIVPRLERYMDASGLRLAVGMNQSYPDMESFAANMAAVMGKLEVIRQPLYDRQQYPLAGTTATFNFFQQPIGAGQTSVSGVGVAAKTIEDTNMTQNGQLPSPQGFWVDNIQVIPEVGSVTTASTYTSPTPWNFNATAAAAQGVNSNDFSILTNAGTLIFSVGQKPYYTLGPLKAFPPQYRARFEGAVSIAGTNAQPAGLLESNQWTEGVDNLPVREIVPGIAIPTGMNFIVQLVFQNTQAITNNARIAVHLGGWLFRAAQ